MSVHPPLGWCSWHRFAPISEIEIVTPSLVSTPASGGRPATTAKLTTAPSVPGHNYQLQTTTNLGTGSWLDEDEPVPGDGAPIIFGAPYDPAEPHRFHRILVTR
ncbi:MAG: hypothetical protein ABI073_12685 [Luteolibacter sp.]